MRAGGPAALLYAASYIIAHGVRKRRRTAAVQNADAKRFGVRQPSGAFGWRAIRQLAFIYVAVYRNDFYAVPSNFFAFIGFCSASLRIPPATFHFASTTSAAATGWADILS
jgi:hypothetical protein